MTIQEFLRYRLENPQAYELNEDEKKCLEFCGQKELLVRRLTSRKFRKSSLNEDAKAQISQAVSINVDKGEPLKFTYPFGGYKSWRTEGFPGADLAEFFTISYVARFAKYISQSYEPGVVIQFTSDDVVIEKIDNYKKTDLDNYSESFAEIMNIFSPYLPANIKLEYRRVVPDLYSPDEYSIALEAAAEEFRSNPDSMSNFNPSGFEFNFLNNGKEDFTGLPAYERLKMFKELEPYSTSYLSLPKRRAFNRGEDKIVIFSQKIPNAIDIGSVASSKAKFWTGTGVIELGSDKPVDRILSPKQLASVKESLAIDELDVDGYGFVVRSYKGRLDFKEA